MDGSISIIIGPNGGGKTNLLDAVVIMFRRYLLSSLYAANVPDGQQTERFEFRHNDVLNNLNLDRHTAADPEMPQIIEVEVEVTSTDLAAMAAMQEDAEELIAGSSLRYVNAHQILGTVATWDLSQIQVGQRLRYTFENAQVLSEGTPAGHLFRDYLSKFQIDSLLRRDSNRAPLRRPLLYLPVTRGAQGFNSRIALAGYQEWEQRRQNEAVSSRSPNIAITHEAISSIALRYRILQEQDNRSAREEFRADPALIELDRILADLGYSWELETISAQRNEYDIRLTKQGSSFLVTAASSGERELLTYLFAIYALNIRDALIIVDEPELHLHPKWQGILLDTFIRLSRETGNQFLMATHSPTFVSPESIQYVSRVYSQDQKSQIVRLQPASLPDARRLFNCVNSQNNERVFFADAVVLVEGLSDRIVFEELFKGRAKKSAIHGVIEVVSVGGKGLFSAYQQLLSASQVQHFVVADLDYVEQIAPPEIKKLFELDTSELNKKVLQDPASLDGDAIVRAIDHAMESNDWTDARDVWAYVKSRRRRLIPDLSEGQAQELQNFLDERAAEGVFVLSKGALEAYLPEGYRGKRIDRLIELVTAADFPEKLPDQASELHNIVETIIRRVDEPIAPSAIHEFASAEEETVA